MSYITSIEKNLYQLELVPYEKPARTTGYLITDDINVLIETGASPAVENILAGFKEIDFNPADIDAIIVTHIHLDHSGGVGVLLTHCPNAKVYVHEKGAKHLMTPDNLVAGARVVYGDVFDRMFEPVVPVPEENIVIARDGDSLRIGENRELVLYNSPGHALHHIIVYDNGTNGIFTGDAGGTFFQSIYKQTGIPVSLPASAPTQFDPVAAEETIDKMVSLSPKRLYFTHYGVCTDVTKCLEGLRKRFRFFGNECAAHFKEHRDPALLKKYMVDEMNKEMDQIGVAADSVDRRLMAWDSVLNAQGVVVYVQRLEKK